MNNYNNAVLTIVFVTKQTFSQDGIGLVVGSKYPIIVAPIFYTKENIHIYYTGFAMVTD